MLGSLHSKKLSLTALSTESFNRRTPALLLVMNTLSSTKFSVPSSPIATPFPTLHITLLNLGLVEHSF